jgi:hypothetical protein
VSDKTQHNPPGTFVRQCAEGLDRVAHTISAAHATGMFSLLDWPELRKYVVGLIDDATEDAGLDRPEP